LMKLNAPSARQRFCLELETRNSKLET